VVLAGVTSTLTACFASPPQIISLTPNRGSIGVPPDTPITVLFDRPVLRSSVAERFSISPSIPGCNLAGAFTAPASAPCYVVWSDGNAQFSLLHASAVLAPDTQYTFTLGAGFREPTGAVNTVDHTWQITTAGAPQVRAVSPAAGATGVPVDGPLTIDFNSGMEVTSTQHAIQLDPPVPGTTVIRNAKDKSRFILVPGRLLDPGVTYRLTVAATARDIHGQRLFAPLTVSFTTGAVSPGGHGLVLARHPNEGATEVLLTGMTPVEDGLPVAAQAALVAPTCPAATGCGAAAAGSPLYTYAAAALSPDDRWLAVVEVDRTEVSPTPTLLVLDAASRATHAVIPDGTLPSWAPDGSTLAYAQASTVHLYHPASGATSSLPPGDPLTAPATWGPSGQVLALDELGADGEHVSLADAVARARYGIPGLTGPASAATLAPDGSTLAVYRSGRAETGTWIVGVGAAPSPPQQLDLNLVPIGFADRATLIARSAPAAGPLALTRISITGGNKIPLPVAVAGAAPTTPISIASSGRQLAFLAAPAGVSNAYIENADGSGAQALTAFAPGTYEASDVALS
jgi:hypothetical protein